MSSYQRTKVAHVDTLPTNARGNHPCPTSPSSCSGAGRMEQRRAFAQAVADSAVEILGARRQDVRMVFSEITPDIVANGGVLASEDEQPRRRRSPRSADRRLSRQGLTRHTDDSDAGPEDPPPGPRSRSGRRYRRILMATFSDCPVASALPR